MQSTIYTKTESQYYNKENVTVDSNCKAICFLNVGIAPIFINNILLYAGESISFNQSENVIDKTIYNISFKTGLPIFETYPNYYNLLVIRTF